MKRNAFGIVDLLLGLLILTAICMLSMKTFNSSINLNGSKDIKSVQEQIDETVNEIENMRLESTKLQQEMLNNEQ